MQIEWVQGESPGNRRGPQPVRWEELLLPRLERNPGLTFRLFTFPTRSKAMNRNQQIRKRLRTVAPDVVVRCEVGQVGTEWGCFATFIERKWWGWVTASGDDP
jgi:hypothetical protein